VLSEHITSEPTRRYKCISNYGIYYKGGIDNFNVSWN